MATFQTSTVSGTRRLLGGAVVAIAGMVLAAGWSAREAAVAFRWVDHTHRVLFELETTLVHAISIQSGVRGFSLSGDERYLTPYESGLSGIRQSLAKLRAETTDNARQQARLVRLSALLDEEISIMTQRLAVRRRGGLVAASVAVSDGRGKQVVDAIRGAVKTMQEEERRLLDERSAAARRAGWTAFSVVLTGAALAAALIAGAMRRESAG